MEAEVQVAEVKAFETKSGNTRFVLRDDAGREYTTFREEIARRAIACEGRKARIVYHENERGGYHNVYLDSVEPLDASEEGDTKPVDEVAWKTAIDAAPWLVGDAPPSSGVPPEEFFEKLKPFKELVSDDIRDDDS